MSKHSTPSQRPANRVSNPPRPLIVRAPLTQEQRNTRCDELAALRGAVKEAARHTREDFNDAGELIHIQFTVESATRADVTYYVDWYSLMGNAYCDCPAGQNDQPCWHAGVARAAGAYILGLIAYQHSPAGRAEAEQEAREERAIEEWRATMYGAEYDR